MKSKLLIIKHIPHCSLYLPKRFKKLINEDISEVNFYNLKMNDIHIDEVFKSIKGKELKAKYSRLFVDVERFKDDNLEIMSKLGQGYKYNKFHDGKSFNNLNYISYLMIGKEKRFIINGIKN